MATLNTHVSGPQDAPAVLAIHGITGHGGRFTRLAREGLPDRRLVAVDLRGHGRSLWTPPWTVDQHVRDLIDTLDAAGLERVDVAGHSYGGLISTHLAAAAPARVRRVVLIDPAMSLDPDAMLEAAEEARVQPSWGSLEEAQRGRAEGRTPPAAEAAAADAAEHAYEGLDGRWRLRYCASAEVVGWGEMVRAPGEYSAPTLLLTAGQEQYVSDRVREQLRERCGDDLREVVMDWGHMLFWDAFDQLASEISAFLA
jgi:lipase